MKGVWIQPKPHARNKPYWHWVHGEDSTAYCGFTPSKIQDTEDHWNPLTRCCRKCLERIAREGY